MSRRSTPQPGPTVLGKTEILNHLGEVADELAAKNLACRLIVVGGSYLALQIADQAEQI